MLSAKTTLDLRLIVTSVIIVHSVAKDGFVLSKTIVNDLHIASTEFCQLESFEAGCSSKDEILLIERAFYGRMKLGRCVKRDYGFLGCSADVLAQLDRFCSGRRKCQFPVAQLHSTAQPCPGDLTPYLEVNYQCLQVIAESASKCGNKAPITLSSHSGYLSSLVTLETGKGSPDCPWRIRVYLGQQINVTLINFARSDPSAMHSGNLTSTSQPRICYRVANIRERQVTKPVTECDDSKRISHVYTSASNLVEIDILSVKAFNVHFLIHYRAVGCANPSVSSGMVLRRRGRYAIVRCNITRNFWRLHCLDSKWDGYLGNCTTWNPTPDPIKEEWNVGKLLHLNSFPFSILLVVSLGVAFGVFIGGVLLVCAKNYVNKSRLMTSTSFDDRADETESQLLDEEAEAIRNFREESCSNSYFVYGVDLKAESPQTAKYSV